MKHLINKITPLMISIVLVSTVYPSELTKPEKKCHKLDMNCDNCIDNFEMALAEDKFTNNQISLKELRQARLMWYNCKKNYLYERAIALGDF
jgi:hypothetical protein